LSDRCRVRECGSASQSRPERSSLDAHFGDALRLDRGIMLEMMLIDLVDVVGEGVVP